MRIMIKKTGDSEWTGYINGIKFDVWYNETEKDLFVGSANNLFRSAGVDFTILHSW